MTIIEKQCEDYGNQMYQNVEEYYTPRIQFLIDEINKKQAEGIDIHNVPYMNGAVKVDLDALKNAVEKAKSDAFLKAEEQKNICLNEAVPDWIGDAQKTADIILVTISLPFCILTRNYALAHIDLGQIYQGYPLGGDNALIPKVRQDILDAAQIHGDVRKFIEDPVTETRKALESIIPSLPPIDLNPFD